MSLETYTLVHVVISLLGIGSGLVVLFVLAAAILARYPLHLAGPWRRVYVVCATAALYFNVFVLVVQAFLKVPALKAMAPHQTEPPFAVAQGFVLVLFIVLGTLAVKRFHAGPAAARR